MPWAIKTSEIILGGNSRESEEQPCLRTCRDGKNQCSPAVLPKPHSFYLDPTENSATLGLNKISLVITRLGGRGTEQADESKEAEKAQSGEEQTFSSLMSSVTGQHA